jgi:hypothetical protein
VHLVHAAQGLLPRLRQSLEAVHQSALALPAS